eukprot:TRINITY_DN16433_c0_g2_i1.p2 TRINITY_DN16433_c0_g2~~TRINITY_DN16433_c0_g2_i1.p2  ORF type:complete len:215 (-),score=41.70 TRINITY_DN16433_c0_g2_i1:154-798(-)
MREYEGMKRSEEHRLFSINIELPFDEEVLKANIRACKVQICSQYFAFQAKLAAIVKEQEKWKNVAKKITEEFKMVRKQRDLFKNKHNALMSITDTEIFNNSAIPEREAQIKVLREINQSVKPVVLEAEKSEIVRKTQAVLDENKKRNKLTIEIPKDDKYADIAAIISKGTAIMKHTVAINKDSKLKQLTALKSSLFRYLNEFKAQRDSLRSMQI